MSHRRQERPRNLAEILARKRDLIGRSADQRQALTRDSGGLSPVFAAGDKVVGVGRSLLSHPVLLAAAGALLIALWPRAVFSAATRGIALWSGAGAVRRLLTPRS